MNRKPSETDKVKVKKLALRVGNAMKYKFYFEATWILSLIFERKLGKIIEISDPRNQQNPTLSLAQSIQKIRSMQASPDYILLTDNLDPMLVERIRRWKIKRNIVYKRMTLITVADNRLEELANEGILIYKALNKSAKALRFGRSSPEKDNEIPD